MHIQWHRPTLSQATLQHLNFLLPSRRCHLFLTFEIARFLWDGGLAKEICQDAGVVDPVVTPAPVPAPTTTFPTPSSPASVPDPSETPVPIPQLPTPSPTYVSPTPSQTTVAPVPGPVPNQTPSPTPFPTSPSVTPTPNETPVPTSPIPAATPQPSPTQTQAPTPVPPSNPPPTPSPAPSPIATPAPTTTAPAPTTPAPAPTTLSPTPSPSLGCAPQIKNIYYHGYDITTIDLDTPEECCTACSNEPRCRLYTHFKSSTTGEKRCYLKSAAGEKTNYGESKTVTAVSAFVNLPTPTPAPSPIATPAPTTTAPAPTTPAPAPTTLSPTPSPSLGCAPQIKNIYYHGYDITTIDLDTPEECCTACSNEPRCRLYTHFKSSTTGEKRCYLKSAAGEKTNYGESKTVTAVSATKHHTSSATDTVPSLGCAPQIKNIYYHGYDITTIDLDTPEECCTACSNEPRCRLYTHFKSSTTGEKRCYLKSAAGEKTNYGESKTVTAVSAFVNLPTPTPAPSPIATPAPTTTAPAPTTPAPAPTTLSPTPSPSLGCAPQIKNIYYHGYDITTIDLDTPEECCTACSNEPRCRLYTHFKSSTTGEKRCYLKSAAGEKTNYGESKTVTAVSAFVNLPTPTPAPSPVATPAPTTTAPAPTTPAPAPTTLLPTPSPSLGCAPQIKNIYYHGYDITTIDLDTPEECCTACSNEPRCRLYTHFKSSTTGEKRCYLKSAAGEKTNYGESKTVTAVSAFVNLPTPTPAPSPIATPAPTTTAPAPTTPAPAPTTLSPTPSPSLGCAPQIKNIYYHGYDITTIDLDTPEECCTACSNEPRCRLYTHFKSSTTGEKRCYLKSAAGEKTNYGESKTVTAVSAFVNLPTPTPAPSPIATSTVTRAPKSTI
ncbi:hypothetical protein FI667_g10708, partial [Globisporangium splendens]